MKKIIIFIGVILILAIGVFGTALYKLNTIVAFLKPQIESTISVLFGGKISYKDIRASVFPTTAIIIDDLVVKKDNFYTLSTKSVSANLDLFPLLSKKLVVNKFSVSDGSATLPLKLPDQRTIDLSLKKMNVSSSVDLLGKLATLSNIKFNAEVLDNIPISFNSSKTEFALDSFNLDVKDFTADLFSNTFKGALAYSLSTKGGNVKLNTGSIELGSINSIFDQISKIFPLPIKKELLPSGKVSLSSDIKIENQTKISATANFTATNLKASVNNNAVEGLNLKGSANFANNLLIADIKDVTGIAKSVNFQNSSPIQLSSPLIKVKSDIIQKSVSFNSDTISLTINQTPIEIAAKGDFENGIVKISDYSVKGFGGSLTGVANFVLSTFAFDFTSNILTLSLPQLASTFAPQAPKILGSIENANLALKGAIGANLISSVNGSVKSNLKGITLEGINILREVFGEIEKLPVIGEIIKLKLPSTIISVLQKSDTTVHDVKSSMTLNSGRANITELVALCDLFTLRGGGDANLLTKAIDMDTTFFLEPRVSQQLSNDVKELKYGLDQSGSLVIPLALQGVPPKILVLPNLKKLAAVVGEGFVKEKAKEVVKDVLDKNGGKLLDGLLGGW